MPRPDVLIVARGGGSIEDLWGFNEEIVVRAAAASRDPADLGRGARDRHHADRLCRRRARADADGGGRDCGAGAAGAARARWTGSRRGWSHCAAARRGRAAAAAARSRPRAAAGRRAARRRWRQRLDMAAGRLDGALRHAAQAKAVELARLSLRPAALVARARAERQRLDGTARRLAPCYADRVGRTGERLAGVAQRLEPAFAGGVGRTRERLDGLERLLKTLGYQATLDRGFAVVWEGRARGHRCSCRPEGDEPGAGVPRRPGAGRARPAPRRAAGRAIRTRGRAACSEPMRKVPAAWLTRSGWKLLQPVRPRSRGRQRQFVLGDLVEVGHRGVVHELGAEARPLAVEAPALVGLERLVDEADRAGVAFLPITLLALAVEEGPGDTPVAVVALDPVGSVGGAVGEGSARRRRRRTRPRSAAPGRRRAGRTGGRAGPGAWRTHSEGPVPEPVTATCSGPAGGAAGRLARASAGAPGRAPRGRRGAAWRPLRLSIAPGIGYVD